MDEPESLNPTKGEFKYHVLFIPKCRRKTLYRELQWYLGEVLGGLAEQKESQTEEGHSLPGHCAHDYRDSPKITSIAGDWVFQGQGLDPSGTGVRKKEEAGFRWSTLLGTSVLGVHGGPR